MAKFEFRVPEEAAGLRLDQCLAREVEQLSRPTARVALDLGAVFVDDQRVKVASRRVSAGQHVVVHLGGAFERAHKQVGRAARELDEAHLPQYEVLFEDEHLVFVYKPAGLLSAPTPEGDTGNLQAQLALAIALSLVQSCVGAEGFRRLASVHDVVVTSVFWMSVRSWKNLQARMGAGP